MFERFTDRARRVVVLSQEEARALDHNYIGTEHILLGLIGEGEGVAAHALAASGVTLEAARSRVEQEVGRGDSTPSGHIPFTPSAKRLLELSLRQALALGHSHIGTEHVLLGLLEEGSGTGYQVVVALGASPEELRSRVAVLLGASLAGPGARSRGVRGRIATWRSARATAASGAGREALVDQDVLWLALESPGHEPGEPGEPGAPAGGLPLVRRLEADARRALVLARAEAGRVGSAEVMDVHLLLGVLAEGDGRGARTLAQVGVTLDAARLAPGAQVARGEAQGPPMLGADALDVLELALVESVGAGRTRIDTGDLLAGCVRRTEAGIGLAAPVLGALGTTTASVREALRDRDAG
jgi:ATP-dependent Clp protease ATP-binding subunit ClpA